MLSRLFGKRDKSADSSKEAKDSRDPVEKDEARESTWSTWDRMQMPTTPPAPPAAPGRAGALGPDSTYTGLAPLHPPKPVIRSSGMAPLSTGAHKPVPTFPEDHQIDFVLPTSPVELQPELTLEERKTIALDTVAQYHPRIANTIRTLWGYKECSAYINRLIMSGGDGMGQARVGFNQDAVAAMLALSDLHDAEFGPPDSIGGGLSLSP